MDASVLTALQWGPGFYTREIDAWARAGGAATELQWGPGFYTREIRGITCR